MDCFNTVTIDRDTRAKLSEAERLRMLTVFDELVPAIPKRPEAEVDAELKAIRRARRAAARRSRPASPR